MNTYLNDLKYFFYVLKSKEKEELELLRNLIRSGQHTFPNEATFRFLKKRFYDIMMQVMFTKDEVDLMDYDIRASTLKLDTCLVKPRKVLRKRRQR